MPNFRDLLTVEKKRYRIKHGAGVFIKNVDFSLSSISPVIWSTRFAGGKQEVCLVFAKSLLELFGSALAVVEAGKHLNFISRALFRNSATNLLWKFPPVEVLSVIV